MLLVLEVCILHFSRVVLFCGHQDHINFIVSEHNAFFFSSGDIPFWVYILIGVGLIFVIAIIVCVVYAKLDRW